MERQNFILIISSPSGAGKTTITQHILNNYNDIKLSVSVTTRTKREGEIEAKDYYFIDHNRFDQMVLNGELLEHARVFDHFYGTLVKEVEDKLDLKNDVLFDIDWQGNKQIRKKYTENVVSIFILPPSIEELEFRLRKRNLDSDKIIAVRMKGAIEEISHWHEYDYIVINDNLEKCVQQIKNIIEAERLKRISYIEFIQKLVSK
jgi:guanylate kinase